MTSLNEPGWSQAGGVLTPPDRPVCKIIVIGGPSEALRDEGGGHQRQLVAPHNLIATRDMRAIDPTQYTVGIETDAAPRIFSEIWSHEFSFLSGLQKTFASMRNSMEQRCGQHYQKQSQALPESSGIDAGSNEPVATRAIPKFDGISCVSGYRDFRRHYRELAFQQGQTKRRTHHGFAIGVWPAISESVSGQSAQVDRGRCKTGRTKTH